MLFGTHFSICMMTVHHLGTHFAARRNARFFFYSAARTPREVEEFWACSIDQMIRSVIIGNESHIKKSVYFREPKIMT